MTNTKESNPKLLNPQLQQSRTRSLVWSGYVVFIWSIAYMIPHLYWALGGTIGMPILKPSVSELPQWELANWVALSQPYSSGASGDCIDLFLEQKAVKMVIVNDSLGRLLQ